MLRSFLAAVVLFVFTATAATARGHFTDGIYFGYAVASPSYPALDAFKARYEKEAFAHHPMELGSVANGGSFGYAAYFGKSMLEVGYQGIGLKSKFTATDYTKKEVENSFKFFQHTFRVSYSYGMPFGKGGRCGLYFGGALCFGSAGIKTQNSDGKLEADRGYFHASYNAVSPQVTLRLRCLTLKAFYDLPFSASNIAPAYNHILGNYGITDASNDATLSGRFSNLGLSIAVLIPKQIVGAIFGGKGRDHSATDKAEREDFERGQKNREEREEYQRHLDNLTPKHTDSNNNIIH